MTQAGRRGYANWIKWVSLVVIVAGLIVIMRQLPVDELTAALDGWLTGLGVWGPVAFGVIYVIATVLFIPASLLTLAAGAVFGIVTGTIVVSIGSTTGAAAAFLIARFVARKNVAGMARGNPRFDAIDRAIGEGGWRIVAMLRLSPLVPFNLQNYLYGLTPIGFWPCVLASWIAMLPGTLMYVYFGRVASLAVTGEVTGSVGRWVFLGIGLIATVAVSVYIAKLAQRKLAEQTTIAEVEPAPEKPDDMQRFPWGTAVIAAIAVTVAGLAFSAQVRGDSLRAAVMGLMGPPQVELTEVYERRPEGPSFDHGSFDQLLGRIVDEQGLVDYAALLAEPGPLDAYIERLAAAPFDDLGRDEKLALLINAYNAFTLRLILDHAPDGELVRSIKDIPAAQRWKHRGWNVGGETWSLNQIEHEQIRPKFSEPRIHFALVCAAIGCPPLRNEAYRADRLEAQLEDQTRKVHEHDRWYRLDSQAGVVRLTPLYKWYGGDFKQAAGSVPAFASRYDPLLEQALSRGAKLKIEWNDYDWRLNTQASKTPEPVP